MLTFDRWIFELLVSVTKPKNVDCMPSSMEIMPEYIYHVLLYIPNLVRRIKISCKHEEMYFFVYSRKYKKFIKLHRGISMKVRRKFKVVHTWNCVILKCIIVEHRYFSDLSWWKTVSKHMKS